MERPDCTSNPTEKKGADMAENNNALRDQLNGSASIVHVLYEFMGEVLEYPSGELDYSEVSQYAERIREAVKQAEGVA